MNEEMTNDVMDIELTEVEVTELEPTEEGGSLAGTIVKGLLVIGGAAGIGWFIKNKKKLAERRDQKAIVRLGKRGYDVYRRDDVALEEVEVEADEIEE